MNKIMYRALLMILGLHALSAQAQDDSMDIFLDAISGGVAVVHDSMTYGYDPNQSAYVLNSSLTRVTGEIVGTGSLADLSTNVNDEFTQIPGRELGGMLVLRLNRNSTPVTLEVRLVIHDEIRNYIARADKAFSLPVEILEGSWDGFDRGESIRLTTSTDANAVFSAAMQAGLNDLLSNAFSEGFENFRLTWRIDSVRLEQPIFFSANREQLTIEKVNSFYQFTVQIGL